MKRLNRFMLQTFLPVFFMTFFICLFIVLMQFLWRYIDELVGKGLEMSVLAELFFYAALTMVPMALPLAILLAALMTFGNLGERLELLAIKAAGISLLQVLKPLVILILFISAGAFFFQNNVLPIAQVKMWTLLYSVRQTSPELDIPEGVFYDQIQGYNLYVKKKDRKTGMLRDVIIYDFSEGFDNSMVVLADSGKLKLTDDKQHLFLTLYSGESFENLRNQRNSMANVPYRRESFSMKEISIAFDGNFNRMDDGVLQNQYIGQDLSQLLTSIDSITHRVDSIGGVNARSLQTSGYFNLHTRSKQQKEELAQKKEEIEQKAQEINIDSLLLGENLQKQQSYTDRALSKAERYRRDYEYRAMLARDENKILRRHKIEMYKKFTLSLACLIFFFIGAPLGAIIRKGGLGMPVVISVFMFIFYYIIDNSGYKMARDGRWEVWQGIWLSTAVLLPLGIFLTYKAIKDSDVFNPDAYINFFRKVIGIPEARKVALKEVIIEDMDTDTAIEQVKSLDTLCRDFLEQYGKRNQYYHEYWLKGYDEKRIAQIDKELELAVSYIGNSRSQIVVTKLMDYPVLRKLWLYRPARNRAMGYTFMILFPIGLPLYLLGLLEQRGLRRNLKTVRQTNGEMIALLEKEKLKENINEADETAIP